MKTVWIINHYAIPPTMGGLNRHYYFSKYLPQKDYNVKLFSASKVHNTNYNFIDDNCLFKEVEIEGILYTFIRTRNYNSGYLSRILNMLDFPINMFRASKFFNKPDVIISSSPNPLACILANYLSKKYGCQSIVEVRDLWPESFVAYGIINKRNPLLRFLYAGEKWIYKNADKLIFTMEGGRDYIIEQGWDKNNGGPIDTDKVYHINNGVDLEVFNYNKEHYQIDDEDLDNLNTFKVIYTGSIRRVNNVKSIIDVAIKIKNLDIEGVKFIIYGDGSDRISLERYVVENNLDNVVFKGFVEKKYIPYILSKSDLNIFHFEQNKIRKYGASLNKLFEYFASGKPTLSDCEFGYDLIKKYQCGVTIDNADADRIAKEIIRFKDMDAEEYNDYCVNAVNAANQYDYKSLSDNLVEIIGRTK